MKEYRICMPLTVEEVSPALSGASLIHQISGDLNPFCCSDHRVLARRSHVFENQHISVESSCWCVWFLFQEPFSPCTSVMDF